MTEAGLYCPAGDFHIDPWRPVTRAVLTHAHADHARAGSSSYLVSREGEPVFRTRLGADANISAVDYGETVDLGGVRLSLHPAGHILGSAQVRVEHRGYVAVVSGDYKIEPDPTCSAFEAIRCHLFVTESTFGLPVYRWPAQEWIRSQINQWWRTNQSEGRASLLLAYALGKSQRLLSGLDPDAGSIFLHGAVARITRDYQARGIAFPPWRSVSEAESNTDWSRAIILAPPSAQGSTWLRRFGPLAMGLASGWMRIRGTRRRKAIDRGFVLSDHADWPGLLSTIDATGAEVVWVTHGYISVLVRYLQERGLEAHGLQTRFEGETREGGDSGEEITLEEAVP
ncbi:MAG: ligase-associated DNA damage response exonuclease [Gemmataceae bacterium]